MRVLLLRGLRCCTINPVTQVWVWPEDLFRSLQISLSHMFPVNFYYLNNGKRAQKNLYKCDRFQIEWQPFYLACNQWSRLLSSCRTSHRQTWLRININIGYESSVQRSLRIALLCMMSRLHFHMRQVMWPHTSGRIKFSIFPIFPFSICNSCLCI